MKIEHIAMWVTDLERSRDFYARYFSAVSGEKYENRSTGFSSYFLRFEDGCRLEIMKTDGRSECEEGADGRYRGLAHFAIAVGDRDAVNQLTETLRHAGIVVVSAPRETGDGYYESVVLDPDGNRIEIAASGKGI